MTKKLKFSFLKKMWNLCSRIWWCLIIKFSTIGWMPRFFPLDQKSHKKLSIKNGLYSKSFMCIWWWKLLLCPFHSKRYKTSYPKYKKSSRFDVQIVVMAPWYYDQLISSIRGRPLDETEILLNTPGVECLLDEM
jgi:hypothetical protein